jgi:hypothetical protein
MLEKEGEIRYWRAIHTEIDEVLKNLEGIILVCHDSIEFIQLIDFINKIKSNHFTNLLYISLTRSQDYMRQVLKQKPIEKKQIFFIDCVSGFAFPTEENIDSCMYHKPPRDFQTMKEIIHFGIERTNSEIVIIDSLSQFVNFSKPNGLELEEFYKFLNDIRNQEINLTNNTFIFLFDTKMGVLSHLPTQGIDSIIKLEISPSTICSLETTSNYQRKTPLIFDIS